MRILATKRFIIERFMLIVVVFAAAYPFRAFSETSGLTAFQLQALLASAPTLGQADMAAIRVLGSAVQANGGDASDTTVQVPGSSTVRSIASRAADLINVLDYGVKCDGQTDDTDALNAVFSKARSISSGWHIVFPTGKICRANRTLNWTVLIGSSNVIDGAGSKIYSYAQGGVAVDALGMRWVKIRDLTIIGDTSQTPKVGLQIGRYDMTANQSSDDLFLDNVQIIGAYSQAALLDEQAETSIFINCNFSNNFFRGKSYTVILDGLNHWNAQSSFVRNLQTVDVGQSFLSSQFVNSSFYHFATDGIPLWLGGTTDTKFTRSYVASIAGPVGVELYSAPGVGNYSLDADIHFETSALHYAFLLTGTDSNPALDGFSYHDENPFFTKSIFKLDKNIAGATAGGAKISVHYAANDLVSTFDEPEKWYFTGNFWSDSPNLWNLPASRYRGSNFTGASLSTSIDSITLPRDSNSVNPVFTSNDQHVGVQVNTNLTAPSIASNGRLFGMAVSGGGDANGQWTIGQGVSDSGRLSTPYLDFAGHGHAQDARIWASNDRRLQVQVSDKNNNLVDMFDCEAEGGCWFPQRVSDMADHYLNGTRLYLDRQGGFWMQEVSNKVVVGTTSAGVDTPLMSIDIKGNVTARGSFISQTPP